MQTTMYQIGFYVPEENLEAVKTAMFDAGAGRLGNYRNCSWQTLGGGQFLPDDGAEPALGVSGKLTEIPEYKVEMLCVAENVDAAVQALKDAHPYEEVAYFVVRLAR